MQRSRAGYWFALRPSSPLVAPRPGLLVCVLACLPSYSITHHSAQPIAVSGPGLRMQLAGLSRISNELRHTISSAAVVSRRNGARSESRADPIAPTPAPYLAPYLVGEWADELTLAGATLYLPPCTPLKVATPNSYVGQSMSLYFTRWLRHRCGFAVDALWGTTHQPAQGLQVVFLDNGATLIAVGSWLGQGQPEGVRLFRPVMVMVMVLNSAYTGPLPRHVARTPL